MDVREAIATRYSCRAFLPDKPVAEAIVRDILERAARAPSGGNLQPWLVHAIAGERLEALKSQLRPRFAKELPRGEGAEYDVYPRELKEPYYGRRARVGNQLYASIAIPREDRPGRYRQFSRNYLFYDAPVGLFVSMDRTMGPPQWSDVGGFLENIMLLARAMACTPARRKPGPTGTRPSRLSCSSHPNTSSSAASRSAMPTRPRRSMAGAPSASRSTRLRASRGFRPQS